MSGRERSNDMGRFFLRTICVAALSLSAVGTLRAQTQAPENQSLEAMEAAGITMSFDVVSIKLNKSDRPTQTLVPMNPTAIYSPTGGLFSATNFRLQTYLAWAYGLSGYEALRMFNQYPQWALDEHFDIEARAQGNPTKAQMQMMMQSLLADRFKLKVHYETKEGPIYVLVLSNTGKAAPQLMTHLDDESCSTPPVVTAAGTSVPCSSGITFEPGSKPGREVLVGRNVSVEQFARFLPAIGVSEIDRPVIDHTGLSGSFDFTIEFIPDLNGPLSPNSEPDTSGQPFVEALRDQLGLILESAKGPVRSLIIDHVEEPSPN
jgi:uncharacterized protein (TIGR03435 family)